MFEYFKTKIDPKGILFLQETHSSIEIEKKWNDEFNGQLFFSHGKTNSCGVVIAFYGNINYSVQKQLIDIEGRILILEVEIENENYLLINLYNANTETEQLKTLNILSTLLEQIQNIGEKSIILGGDFNFYFNEKLETSGGSPLLKKHSISNFLEIKEGLNLCDLWRVRNPKMKTFTFRQRHFSGLIQRRLDYLFISQKLQESVKKIQILSSFSSDHSPILASFVISINVSLCGPGLWKFNNSLVTNAKFVDFNKDPNLCDRMKSELLKYEIRSFSINFSKNIAKQSRILQNNLEKKIKSLESNLDNDENFQEYTNGKNELETIYSKVSEGIRIRSKTDWYQYGEKSTKYFLNLEKQRAVNGTVRQIIHNDNEINNPVEIRNELKIFYENLFKQKSSPLTSSLNSYLENIQLPLINNEMFLDCEKEFALDELFLSMKSMENGKTPGNDGITNKFYETFWDELKFAFIKSINQAKVTGELSISQSQAVIKLIEKKDRDKRFIKNWRPISLLNVDTKIISKAMALRLLPSIISTNQTAYVNKRCISESGRLISDILEICDKQKIGGFLVTMDIEKAFDSLDHNFLLTVLAKFGFGNNFLSWIKILLKKQLSCVINGGFTTSYFNLEKGARQGDPASVYLFILALEVLFISIKNNQNIKGLEIFKHEFLYTAYADDSTFFLKNIKSVKELIKSFERFYPFSGLKSNIDNVNWQASVP